MNMLPKKVPEDDAGAQAPETKPRVPFAVGDVANWHGIKLVVDAFIDYRGEPRILCTEAFPGCGYYLIRDSDLSPWVELE